jgi:hypothetical protein
LPLIEIVIILYVNLFVFNILLNFLLYFDVYNYVIKKDSISCQQFRKQHSVLALSSFILAGYISSIILNGQFLTYPNDFDFGKFQNIILVYQIFLSAITILISLNGTRKKEI